jgi:hypothetical protein
MKGECECVHVCVHVCVCVCVCVYVCVTGGQVIYQGKREGGLLRPAPAIKQFAAHPVATSSTTL